MSILKAGKAVRAVIYSQKCKLLIDEKEEKAPDAIGGMKLKTFEFFAKGSVKNEKAFVTSSETMLISHPRYGFVYNCVKLRIYKDGFAEIVAGYFDPKTFEVKMDEIFYSLINNSPNDGVDNNDERPCRPADLYTAATQQ